MLKRHKDSKNKVSKIKKKYKKQKKKTNIKRFTFIAKASIPTCYLLIPINNINPNLHLTPKDDIFLKIQKILFKFQTILKTQISKTFKLNSF